MRPTTAEIRNKVDELLVVLDNDIQYISRSLSHLDQLRSLVIKRDHEELGRLLENIRKEADIGTVNELKRQSIRKQLAAALDCRADQLRLSMLKSLLPKEMAAQVSRRREQLLDLTEQLRRQYQSTAMLVSECARLNRMLLDSVFNLRTADAVTYDANGTPARQTDTAFVNLHF